MLGEEYALNTRFEFDGKEYVAKVASKGRSDA